MSDKISPATDDSSEKAKSEEAAVCCPELSPLWWASYWKISWHGQFSATSFGHQWSMLASSSALCVPWFKAVGGNSELIRSTWAHWSVRGLSRFKNSEKSTSSGSGFSALKDEDIGMLS